MMQRCADNDLVVAAMARASGRRTSIRSSVTRVAFAVEIGIPILNSR
jgi:hypothetical protein